MNIALIWFRQDLRLMDNPAFAAACDNHEVVIPLYIYDQKTSVLGRAQQWWLHHSLEVLRQSLQKRGLTLILRQGNSLQIISELMEQLSIQAVYWNRCYEPLAIERDKKIKSNLLQKGISVNSFNSSLLNEPWTIQNKQGSYFKVFSPFWKHCLQKIMTPLPVFSSSQPKGLAIQSDDLSDWNLLPTKPNWASKFPEYWQPGEIGAQKNLYDFIENNLDNYKALRDIPSKKATSRLSPHLHFGEISPWTVWRSVETAKLDKDCDIASADHFLFELGWREFSYYLLYHIPTLPHANFRKEFNAFQWNVNETFLKRWQTGTTGYPIVDAGMRELWATGYMHNRVRMIVASFLTKDLLIDWQSGADWFLDTLLDADLANNSMSWQWVAGCGVDAAPYFRIFNPVIQSEKFDPNGTYIRQWVPEIAHLDNKSIHKPFQPIVDHDEARKKALEHYKDLRRGIALS